MSGGSFGGLARRAIIHMSVRAITGPNSYSTLNTYQVDKRTGRVNPAVGEDFNLYD